MILAALSIRLSTGDRIAALPIYASCNMLNMDGYRIRGRRRRRTLQVNVTVACRRFERPETDAGGACRCVEGNYPACKERA